MLLFIERLQRTERGVESKKSVKVDQRLPVSRAWRRYGYGRTEAVIELLSERRDYIETIGRPALEDGHEDFLVSELLDRASL
jgi:hypothetical protein